MMMIELLKLIVLLALFGYCFPSLNNCSFPDYDQGAADIVPILNISEFEKNSPLGKKLYRNESETSIDYSRDMRPLHQLMIMLSNPTDSNERWTRNKNITIVVLGGSQTTGNGINSLHIQHDPKNILTEFCNNAIYIDEKLCIYDKHKNAPCKPCAFPRRFEFWLQNAYPLWHIQVYNLAKAGTNSGSILPELSSILSTVPEPIDLALVNYAGNDIANNGREAEFVSATFEAMLRLLMYQYHIPVVAMEMLSVPRFAAHEKVLEYYRVPTVRYDEASTPETKAYDQHLPWPFHQLFANFLAYFWSTEVRAICSTGALHHHSRHVRHDGRPKLTHRPPMPELKSLRRFVSPECVLPITSIRAEGLSGDKKAWKHEYVHLMPPTSRSTDGTGAWRFGEDKKGSQKRGWYIDSLSGGTIKFTIEVNAADPKVVIGYLQSYECRGTVRVYLDDDITDVELINSTGSSTLHVSQTYPHQVCLKKRLQCKVDDGSAGERDTTSELQSIKATRLARTNLTLAQKYIVANLTVDLLPVDNTSMNSICGNRFKILYVMSC